jgi:hypothetical protein
MVALLILAPISMCVLRAAAPDVSAEPRMSICLNGTWDSVLNADGARIPAEGWSPRRAPALPIAGNPPATSVWYRYNVRIPVLWIKPERTFLLKIDKAGHYTAVWFNGKLVGEHYGQYSPFETDVTAALKPGESNEIAIFVHNASGKYARPGVDVTDPMEGNAYRGATDNPAQRNWIGIVGDISLEWHPAAYIRDVFVTPSVRRKQLSARVETVGTGAYGAKVRATVLDNGYPLLELPEQPITGNAVPVLITPWADAVLWGPEPYGKPKLYVLRTELMRGGKVVDRSFTRFGFREVWVEGKDVMLNGKKLWMSGTYFGKLAPIRYLNDRRPEARMLQVMQQAGLNTLHGHWDDLGEPWLDLCDEMGMLVLGGMYCDGRPQIQSKAGPGWSDFMLDACRRWTRTVRHHASIVAWRPADSVMPPGANSAQMTAKYMDVVRAEDGTRPFATDNEQSEIAAHSQSPLKNPREPNGEYEDGSVIAQKLAASTRPVLTKEIYAGFRADVFDKLSQFFHVFYQKSWDGRGTGVIVQHIPLIQRQTPFKIQWLSDSGPGNRDAGDVPEATLPNWCDPSQPVWTPSPYAKLFADLWQQYMKRPPVAATQLSETEVLVSGLKPNELAILLPKESAVTEPLGMRAAADGTAWIVLPRAGEYKLVHDRGSLAIRVRAQSLAPKPGYDYVERVKVK